MKAGPAKGGITTARGCKLSAEKFLGINMAAYDVDNNAGGCRGHGSKRGAPSGDQFVVWHTREIAFETALGLEVENFDDYSATSLDFAGTSLELFCASVWRETAFEGFLIVFLCGGMS